jgi:hypothetical protein
MGLWSVITLPPLSLCPHNPFTAAEVVIHGEPSGLDNTTSCFGGAVRLNRSLGRFETLPHLPSMNILLTNTKSPRKTKLLVKKVRELNEALPLCVKPIFESVEAISQEFLQMIEMFVHRPLPLLITTHPFLRLFSPSSHDTNLNTSLSGPGDKKKPITKPTTPAAPPVSHEQFNTTVVCEHPPSPPSLPPSLGLFVSSQTLTTEKIILLESWSPLCSWCWPSHLKHCG